MKISPYLFLTALSAFGCVEDKSVYEEQCKTYTNEYSENVRENIDRILSSDTESFCETAILNMDEALSIISSQNWTFQSMEGGVKKFENEKYILDYQKEEEKEYLTMYPKTTKDCHLVENYIVIMKIKDSLLGSIYSLRPGNEELRESKDLLVYQNEGSYIFKFEGEEGLNAEISQISTPCNNAEKDFERQKQIFEEIIISLQKI